MSFLVQKYKWNGYDLVKIFTDAMALYVNPDMVSWMGGLNLSGKNIIDGGCNIGMTSLLFSDAVCGCGIVYAFELQRLIFQFCCTNAILNNKWNIVAFNNALSDKSGEWVGFTQIDYGAENISSVGVKTEPKLGHTPYYDRVKTIAIDDLDLQNVGLIKLDLEGHEPQALDGMWQTIDRCKPHLIIELSPGYLAYEESRDKETIEKIKQHGYNVNQLSDYNFIFEPI